METFTQEEAIDERSFRLKPAHKRLYLRLKTEAMDKKNFGEPHVNGDFYLQTEAIDMKDFDESRRSAETSTKRRRH